MLARRIIAVSPDAALGKRLTAALNAAGGVVDTHATLGELGTGAVRAALLVLHVEDEPAAAAEVLSRLTADTRVIAILPRTNLAAIVAIMQASDRVAGMLVADDLDPRELTAMAARVLVGDIFGIDKLVPWGTRIHNALVGDYQEKVLCIAQVSEFAKLMGLRRKYRDAIEQCLDEMLMNALYDAPVDDQGRPIFSDIPTKTRISLRVEQKVVVQYACDSTQFVIAVRDAFGTLERSTVLSYLHKCLHHEQQIDRKAGGAGLGLYLMTSSSTSVLFNVLPGIATEAVCTFEIAGAKVELERFGFFTERIDTAGRLAAGPSRRLPAGTTHPVERRRPALAAPSRGVLAVLVGAIVVTLALVVIAAWPRLFGARTTSVVVRTEPPGAAIEIEGKNAGTATDGTLVIRGLEVGRAYPLVARLDGYEPRQAVVQPSAGDNAITLGLIALAPTVGLDTRPSGAAVTIDGAPVGTTPLQLTTLVTGTTVQLGFRRPGYVDAATQLEVPGPGKELRLVQPMTVSPDFARIRITSEPTGATITLGDQLLAGVTTPEDVLVEADKPARFVVAIADRVPVVLGPFTPPRGGDGIVHHAALVAGHALRVTANVDGRATISPAPHCAAASVPLACIVAPGAYEIDFVSAHGSGTAGARVTRRVTVADHAHDERIELGFVDAGPARVLRLPGGQRARRAAFEAGAHKVVVKDGDGVEHTAAVVVRAGATVVAP